MEVLAAALHVDWGPVLSLRMLLRIIPHQSAELLYATTVPTPKRTVPILGHFRRARVKGCCDDSDNPHLHDRRPL